MIYFKHSVCMVYFQNCMMSLIRNDNKDNIGDICECGDWAQQLLHPQHLPAGCNLPCPIGWD